MWDGSIRSRGPVAESIAALVTVMLTVLGLGDVAPELTTTIAIIVLGGGLLLHGFAIIGEYAHASVASPTGAKCVGDVGLAGMLLAGATGVVLGILAFLGFRATGLTTFAVIAFGGAFSLRGGSVLLVNLWGLGASLARKRNQRVASKMLLSSAGFFGLGGLSAILLGVLALARFNPADLVMIALLTLGCVNAITGVDITYAVASACRRSL